MSALSNSRFLTTIPETDWKYRKRPTFVRKREGLNRPTNKREFE